MTESDIPVGGWMSRRIWEVHDQECQCGHCLYVEAHMDDDDDVRGGNPWL